jgi:hypothetical protein
VLSGYAWSSNAGWIQFNTSCGGVTLDSATGNFSGYAWAENIGWINLNSTSPAPTPSAGLVAHNKYPVYIGYVWFATNGWGNHGKGLGYGW